MVKSKKKSGGQAFEAQRESIFRFDPDELIIIGHDTDHKKGEHPLFQDVVEPSAEFVANVAAFGVQEPVLIMKDGERPVVVAGRKRTIALRLANVQRARTGQPALPISAKQVKGALSQLAAIMVIENEQRAQPDAVTRGEHACQLSVQGFSSDDLATIYGQSKATVENLLHLGAACAELKTAVREEKITATRAYSIARKSAEKQQELVKKALNGHSDEPKARDYGRIARGLATRFLDIEWAEMQKLGISGEDFNQFQGVLKKLLETEA